MDWTKDCSKQSKKEEKHLEKNRSHKSKKREKVLTNNAQHVQGISKMFG
jgi:hypothetical protein